MAQDVEWLGKCDIEVINFMDSEFYSLIIGLRKSFDRSGLEIFWLDFVTAL